MPKRLSPLGILLGGGKHQDVPGVVAGQVLPLLGLKWGKRSAMSIDLHNDLHSVHNVPLDAHSSPSLIVLPHTAL